MFAKDKEHGFRVTCAAVVFLTVIVTASALTVAFRLPEKKEVPVVSVIPAEMPIAAETVSFEPQVVAYDDSRLNIDLKGDDVGLALYRDLTTRPAVEWFYSRITGSRTVAQAVLAECDKNEITPSLAFSLAYMESRYDAKATHTNKNQTVDRGLFQLNSRTFAKLSEADFFDPAVNARHGLAHLRFCMGATGNTVSALAMYNAGATRVRQDSTPQTTLSYIGKIMGYKQNIEKLFADEVLRYYSADEGENNVTSPSMNMSQAVAYNK